MSTSKENMKTRIVKAVFTVMKQKAIPDITVENVIKEAKIARSSFYRYYDTIDEVIKEEEQFFLDEILAINKIALRVHGKKISSEITESQIRRMELFLTRREEVLLLFGSNGDLAFRHKIDKIMAEYFRTKYSYYLNTNDINIEFYIRFMTAGHHSIVLYWLSEHPEISPIQIASMMNKFFYSVVFENKLNLME